MFALRVLLRAAVLSAAVLAGTVAQAADTDAFQRLKALQGEWVAVDDSGKATDQVISIFRVTSGGNAVREIMFPGSDREMVNMYYRDGETVQMIHFCASGNQPHMRLVPSTQPNALRLVFIDVTNLKSANDEHMHEGQFVWVNPDHLKTEWRAFKNGKYSKSTRFDMLRRK